MQKAQIPQKQKELFEDAAKTIKEMRAAGFDSAAYWFGGAVDQMREAFRAFKNESEVMTKPEPRVVNKDKPGPEGLVVSFSPTRNKAYFYIGEDLLKGGRFRIGDKIALRGNPETTGNKYCLAITNGGPNTFTLTSAGGAVAYLKVTIPTNQIRFKRWEGRRAVDFQVDIGQVVFTVE